MDLRDCIRIETQHLITDHHEITTKKWQGAESPPTMIEVLNTQFSAQMPETESELVYQTRPYLLGWCRSHFIERVGGKPLNPPPSHKDWLPGNEKFLSGEKFSHSYPERYWPKGLCTGIRFEIGDLATLVEVLQKEPDTRQAVLPMFYPEDLSASLQNERVPCSLYWHFMIRNGRIDCWYDLRSCDALRHFTHDIYFAVRLTQWIRDQLPTYVKMGDLHFCAHSFHAFKNDMYGLTLRVKEFTNDYSS